MRILVRWLAAALMVWAAAAGGADVVKAKMESGGRNRNYLVHIPPSYDGAAATPLVLVLHGGGGKAARMDKLTGFNALADKYGFLVCYPEGIAKGWNDGREGDFNEKREGVDDVAFLAALVTKLAQDYNVDRKRVFTTGISNGAFMSYRLACERPDVFAAAAGVVGGVSEYLAANHPPREPIAVMMIVGTEDPLVPFAGGNVEVLGAKRGEILPQNEAVKWWVEHNGCEATPTATTLADADPDDGTKTHREDYKGPAGADVAYLKVEGGGHTWAGGWQYLPAAFIGKTARDFNAGETIWAFFAAHPKL